MSQEKRFFALMVVGDNPEEIIAKYDMTKESEPYVKFRYKDAGKLRKKAIKMSEDVIANANKINCSQAVIDYFKEKVAYLNNMSDFEYYQSITDGLSYNEDGDAISTENEFGKYKSCQPANLFAIPLTLKNGTVCFQARAGDVDWESMHMRDEDVYTVTWKLFHHEIEPRNDIEKKIYENVKLQKNYFASFDNIDHYVKHCCSYWCYAYADKDGWIDADESNDYEWISGFYDRFVKKLKPDDLVTIFECTKE